jgi:hypothetical protein
MELTDYLREQAAMYRKLAEQAEDPFVKNEMLELASVCEEVADNIEDHLTGGDGSTDVPFRQRSARTKH